MSDATFTATQLDSIFGEGAGAHAKQFLADAGTTATDAVNLAADVASHNIPAAVSDAVQTVRDAIPAAKDAGALVKSVANAAKVFYHLYVCRFTDCLKAANPLSGSWHQRGLHLATSTPRTDVPCPGCGKPMIIGRDGLNANGTPHSEGHLSEDKDGNAVLHGNPIVQEAPGQQDQTAELQKEIAGSAT